MQIEYLILINIFATMIVGFILKTQIKSQKDIITNYKGLVNSLDTSKIVKLKEIETEQIRKNLSSDIKILQQQVSEMSYFVNHVFNTFEELTTEAGVPDFINRESLVFSIMPSCQSLINKQNFREL